jgi:hypothetical protein
MPEQEEQGTDVEAAEKPRGCCCGDPYASLLPGMRPKATAKKDGLRQVTCPKCGLVTWTNRDTDICIRCG